MPTLTFYIDRNVSHWFIEVRAAKGSKITSTTPACAEKTDHSISWIVTGLPSNQVIVPLPSSEIITSDKVEVTCSRLSYEAVGPGERAGYEDTLALTPPLRYHSPVWPPVGPPVVIDCCQVPACDLKDWLDSTLTTLRLPLDQRHAFMMYWLPMMQVYPFLLIRFLPDYESHDRLVSKLSLLPEPASIRRVFMTWQGVEGDKLDELELDEDHVQNFEQIAEDSIQYFDVPPWPPVADPNMSDFDRMHSPDYGYVELPSGLWEYTLLIDESKKPPIIDVVEWGGACMNHLTPDVYALEMFKVTRV
jgi:hypothetical protein